jgi:hypothetical protein
MCYVVLLGTDADVDLSLHDAGMVNFTRSSPADFGDSLLQFPQHWIVSVGTCSCGFRHLHTSSVDLGFSEPVDWLEESVEDILATKYVIGVIRALVAGGASVECIDFWWGQWDGPKPTLRVDLDTVSDTVFRFFENHRFVFTGGSK